MIIAIDGYEANEPNRVGIGQYAYQTINHLYPLILKRDDVSIRIHLPNFPVPDMPKTSKHWQYIVRKPKKLWTFGALPLSIYLDRPSADVVFSPTHYVPRYINNPRVFSVMDVSFLLFPQLFNKKDLYQLKNWTEYSVEHSKAVFTISEFSRNAIIELYNYPRERVFVTYPGITMNITTTNRQIKRTRPYILSVGTIQPRKNYEKLIQSFSMLKRTDLDLIIVGKKGWLYESILDAPRKFGVEKNVHFLDFVPDEELPGLYANAECFVLVSLYEGFGLPVLEAMANSCPIVVSNVSSLPEIAGDAAIYVEPENVQSILNGLEIALEEKSKKNIDKRIKIGLERVKLFSWEKAAEQTLDVLEKVGKGEL